MSLATKGLLGALSLDAAAPRGFSDGVLVPGAREIG